MATLRRSLLMILLVFGASSAQASLIFELTSDHCTGGCGTPPFGTVTLTQSGANVDIVVALFGGSVFVKTGAADDQAFKFNAVDVVTGDITITSPPTPTLQAQTGAFNGDGTGEFDFGIACPSCKNGGAGAFAGPIAFTVANATIADLTVPNNFGNVFVADILSGQTGRTGPVDATRPIPEPGPALLFGIGSVLAGAAIRRRS